VTADDRLRTPPAYQANCELCNGLLDTRANGVHQWTAGWVMQRSGGGGHGISLPVRESRWAHGDCINLKTRGLLNQPVLF